MKYAPDFVSWLAFAVVNQPLGVSTSLSAEALALMAKQQGPRQWLRRACGVLVLAAGVQLVVSTF